MILSHLNDLYRAFSEFTKSNQIVGGAISLWGLGMVTYLMKDIPKAIIDKIVREATTTLVVNSADPVFYDFLKWVSANKNHSFVRNLNLMNPTRWGDATAILSIGYGRVYFTFNKHLLYMDRAKEQGNQTAERKEEIILTLVGRQKKVFEKLFDNIRVFNKDDDLYTKMSDDKKNNKPGNTNLVPPPIKNSRLSEGDLKKSLKITVQPTVMTSNPPNKPAALPPNPVGTPATPPKKK